MKTRSFSVLCVRSPRRDRVPVPGKSTPAGEGAILDFSSRTPFLGMTLVAKSWAPPQLRILRSYSSDRKETNDLYLDNYVPSMIHRFSCYVLGLRDAF